MCVAILGLFGDVMDGLALDRGTQRMQFLCVLGVAVLIFFVQADTLTNRAEAIIGVPVYKAMMAGVLGVALAGGMTRRAAFPPRAHQYAGLAVFLFIGAAIAGFYGAEDKALASSTITSLASLAALFFLCLLVARERAHLNLLLIALIGSAAFSGLFVLLDNIVGSSILATSEASSTAEWEGVARSAGASDYNPTTSAAMIVTGFLMAVVFAIETPRVRFWAGAAAGIAAIAIVLSFARSAVLAVGLVGVLMAITYRNGRLFPLALMSGVLVAAAMIPFIPEAYWERLGTLIGMGTDTTLSRRLSYNLIGLQLFVEHPVFGVGAGNFEHHFVQPEYRYLPGRTWLPRQLHNTYLMALVEYGVLGFASFAAIITVAMQQLRKVLRTPEARDYHTTARALMFGYIGFLICCLFLPGVDYKYSWILPALCLALSRLALPETDAITNVLLKQARSSDRGGAPALGGA